MATPIQHTSQFIPTDLGVLERNLAATQQRADSAVQGLLQADAQFGSTIAANQDLEAKQNVIKNFRARSEEVLQRYGGDPAKASKELAREVVKAGNDPFWQVNKAKQKGIEQANQMRIKMGGDYIEGRDPANLSVKDEEGNYRSPEDFNPIAYSHGKLSQGLDLDFGGEKTELRDTVMQVVDELPGDMLSSTRIRGVMQGEVDDLADRMYNQLRDKAPLGSEQQLRDLAQNKAQSYVQGSIDNYMQNPEFGARAGAKRDLDFLPNMTTKLTDRAGVNMSPSMEEEVLKNIQTSGGTMEENYKLNIRKKFLRENPDVKEFLLEDTHWNPETESYESMYSEEDFLKGNINEMFDEFESELKSIRRQSKRALRTDRNEVTRKANKQHLEEAENKLEKLYRTRNKLKSEVETYYDETTGDYTLPVFGFDESLDAALKSGMKPSTYNTQVNAVKKNMQNTLDKYIIGEDLIIESGGYDEEFQEDVTEAQTKGKSLNDEEAEFAKLKRKGGMDFLGVTGNSYTGVKFIVKDSNGNQHIVKPATDVVLKNLLNNLNMPELYEMDHYKEDVRQLIPGNKVENSDVYYEETNNQPFLVKEYNDKGEPEKYVTYRDYISALDKLNLTEEEEENIALQLSTVLSNRQLTLDSPYSPGENNQYKLIKLINLLNQ